MVEECDAIFHPGTLGLIATQIPETLDPISAFSEPDSSFEKHITQGKDIDGS